MTTDQPKTPPNPGSGSASAPASRKVSPEIRGHLGSQLRAVYDELAARPVPDRFAQLLDALEQQNSGQKPKAAAPSATDKHE